MCSSDLHRGRLVKELSAQELEQECSVQGIDVEQYFLNLILKAGGVGENETFCQ